MKISVSFVSVMLCALIITGCGGDVSSSTPSLTVTSTSPTGTKVLRDSNVQVVFGDTLDCATVTASTFSVTLNSVAVAGVLNCSNDTVIFTPTTADMLFSQTYLVSFTTGIKNITGNLSTTAANWSFTTKTQTLAVQSSGGFNISKDTDNSVWTWGETGFTLGRGINPSATPAIVDIANASVIGKAYDSAFVGKADGTSWAWGNNIWANLGDGTSGTTINNDRATPVQTLISPALPAGVTIISYASSDRNTLALRSDGKVMAWGENGSGQLGDGTTTQRLQAVEVTALAPAGGAQVIALAAGDYANSTNFSLALKSDGTVWAWGDNSTGQLARLEPGLGGTVATSLVPLQLAQLSGIVSISAGNGFGVAVKNDGTVWAWGNALEGQLGDGTCGPGDYIDVPVQVKGPGGIGFLANVASVSATPSTNGMSYYTLALKTDGTVWGWGHGGSGELGDGTTGAATTLCRGGNPGVNLRIYPVQTTGLTGITAISAGDGHATALQSNGTVWAWGDNTNFRLGDGTTTTRLTPVKVKGL